MRAKHTAGLPWLRPRTTRMRTLVITATLIVGTVMALGADMRVARADALLQVSAGYYHNCGIKTDGTVACWGWNDDGQATPPDGTFMQVSAGGVSTCGIKADGTLACWGANSWGQATPPAGAFTQVSAAGNRYCGVRTDSTVACWGTDFFGESSPPAGNFTQVATGEFHTCGIKTDETLACWGANSDGQTAAPPGTFTQVSADGFHTCGLKTDDTVVCWGSWQTSPIGEFTQVSAGYYHSCGVRTDHSVACWDDNQLGQATPPAGTFTQVSGGRFHTCGVGTDGTVDCWGWNEYGQATPPVGLVDSDGDSCTDGDEVLLEPPTDPDNPWDFYSVPVPALFAAQDPQAVFKDRVVSASDAQAVFGYFKKAAKTGSIEYEQDLNNNGVKDGLEYDRSFAGAAQSGPPNGVIGASDAQLAFAQFKKGYRC